MPGASVRWLQRIGYRAYADVAFPLTLAATLPLQLLKRKRRETLFARFGLRGWPRPDEGLEPIWFHALSVGEMLSAERVIEALCDAQPGRPVFLSVSTLAGFELARERLGERVDALFYFPYDCSWVVGRSIEAVRPAAFVLVESDIWPHFMAALGRRGVPSLLVNGRLSSRSLRFYTRWRAIFVPTMRQFRWVYPQSEFEADRFGEAGVPSGAIRRCGNLKFDVDVDKGGTKPATLAARLAVPSGARVLVAGSTHPGEEALVRDAYRELRVAQPDLVLILAPREPDRAREVVALFEGDGARVLSALEDRSDDAGIRASVVVVDRIGVLRSLYGLADVAFVGGSLVQAGGHNPIEPAAWGKPVVFGPDMEDFPDVSRWLIEAGGGFQVGDAAGLAQRCRALLTDRRAAREAGTAARAVVDRHRGTTRALVEDILSLLPMAHAAPAPEARTG